MSTHAVLEWRNGLPYSPQFDDVYFSVSPDQPQHGLAETRYVFLEHNQLSTRWQQLPTQHPSHFVIVETGFGSGLNFLAALQLWRETAPPQARLHFVSVEIAPFTLDDLQTAHRHFPELAEVSAALCRQYQLLQPGINQLELPEFKTCLTLFIGDSAAYLPSLRLQADAWFLDGFAPAKNPQMWQPYLFESMAQNAHAGTTFATFTSAGIVKRGLQSVGFQVKKSKGFGHKREMLSGFWPAPSTPAIAVKKPPKVAVIGAGIAGCSTAWQLANLGCEVAIFEKADRLATGASGNPRGMLYPRLNAEKPQNDQLAWRSYSFSLRHYANLALGATGFAQCGLLQLGGSPREYKRVQKVSAKYGSLGIGRSLLSQVNPEEASSIAGIRIDHACLYFADGGWVNPTLACEAMINHPHIQLHTQQQVVELNRRHTGWQLTLQPAISADQTCRAGFDVVVVCNAAEAASLIPDSGMWLNPVRGQMGMIATDTSLQGLQTILCGDGYLTPALDGQHAMGATFAPGETDTSIREADNQANLTMVSQLSPALTETKPSLTAARASLRCGSPDYLPYVGPVLPVTGLQALGAAITDMQALPAAQGLYVHVAHGSKGLMTAPYCAAMLARRILLDANIALPQVSEDRFWWGLHPQRLMFKQLGWKALLNPFTAEAAA